MAGPSKPKALKDLTLDDYRDNNRFRWEKTLPRGLYFASSITFEPKNEGHSAVGTLICYDGQRQEIGRFFVKQYNHSDSPSGLYQRNHDPNADFFHEWRTSGIISRNVDRNLIPPVLATSSLDLATIFTFLPEDSDQIKLLSARQLKNDAQKLDLIHSAARRIAYFDGMVYSRKEFFRLSEPSISFRTNQNVSNLVDYLLSIVRYQHQNVKNEEVPSTDEGLRELIRTRYGVNLGDSVAGIIEPSLVLEGELRPQHGDLRVHHKKSSRFVDLANFSLKTHGYDLTTYLNAEGSISRPPTSTLPHLLADFLVYEKASSIPNAKRRREVLRGLDFNESMEGVRSISHSELNTFIMQVLYQDCIENLHLDASNKRYSEAQLAQYFQCIPKFTKEEMMTKRLSRVKEDLESIADNDLTREAVEHPTEVKKTFKRLAELLLRLELIDLAPRLLNKLS